MGIVAFISFLCVFSAYSIASLIISLFECSYNLGNACVILFETIPLPRTFFGAAIITLPVFIFTGKIKGQMIATDTQLLIDD